MSKSREDKNIDELKASVARLRTSYINTKSRISELTEQINENEERISSLTAEVSRLPENMKKGKKSELIRILEATRRLKKHRTEITGIKNMTGRMLRASLKKLRILHRDAGHHDASAAVVVDDSDDDDGDDSGAGAGAVVHQQRTKLGCSDCRHPEQCSRCKAEERAAAKKSANRSSSAASLEDSDSGAGVAPIRRVSPKSSAASNPKPVVPLEVAMAVAAPASARSRSPSPKRGCWPWCGKKSQGSRSTSKSPSWWKKHFSRKNKDGNPPPTGGRRCKTNKRQNRRGTLRK